MTDHVPPPPGESVTPEPAVASVPLPPGYVLVGKLGSGGFATVWLAEQGRLGRRVAIKVLSESVSDSERERRFIAECQAIGRLSGHPSVVVVHDAGMTAEGHPYLVMEHLPGGSLHDRLRDGPMPSPDVLPVGVAMADALAAAHDAGILHRDVKPANILLDANGDPKLGDFGIARLSEGAHSATGTLVGTIPFTPPEVLSGQRPGPTADLWALGATLHTLLTAHSPFSGDADEPPAATVARVLMSQAPPLPETVPQSLRNLVIAMLATEPGHRPQDALSVVRVLQGIQAAQGLAVTPARSTRGDAPPTLPIVAPLETPPPTPQPSPLTPSPFMTPQPAPLTPQPAVLTPPPFTAPQSSPATPEPVGADRRRRGKGALIAAAVLVFAVVLVGAALIVAPWRDDGGSADGGGTSTSSEPDGSSDFELGPDEVTTIWGVPVRVPAGVDETPAEVPGGARAVDCAATLACSGAAIDDDVIVGYSLDGGATTTVERFSATDGQQQWAVQVSTPNTNLAVAVSGGRIIMATSEDDTRVYRALDPDSGAELWDQDLRIPNDERPVRPSAQLSDEVMILMLTGVEGGAAVGIDYESGGEVWRFDGHLLAADARRAYFASGGVTAIDLHGDGEEWTNRDIAVDNDGRSPAGRLGVVVDQTLVTVSAGEVLGLDIDDGLEAWDHREPISEGEDQIDTPLAVAFGGGRAIVAAQAGDIAVDPESGEVAWRIVRDPFIVEGENNVWIGTNDKLVVGQLGSVLRAVDPEGGSEGNVVDLTGAGSAPTLSSIAYVDGVGVLGPDGLAGYDMDLDPTWTHAESAGARAVVAVKGGLVVIGEAGITLLRQP